MMAGTGLEQGSCAGEACPRQSCVSHPADRGLMAAEARDSGAVNAQAGSAGYADGHHDGDTAAAGTGSRHNARNMRHDRLMPQSEPSNADAVPPAVPQAPSPHNGGRQTACRQRRAEGLNQPGRAAQDAPPNHKARPGVGNQPLPPGRATTNRPQRSFRALSPARCLAPLLLLVSVYVSLRLGLLQLTWSELAPSLLLCRSKVRPVLSLPTVPTLRLSSLRGVDFPSSHA